MPLRDRKGLNLDAVATVLAVLEICAFEWAGSDFVPKREMSILVDLYPAMVSCAGLYDSDVAAAIELAGDQIADLIRTCVRVDWNI
jgi:hypothetical protein